MHDNLLSTDSAVKRHVLANDSARLPFVSMSASTPGEESTLGERLAHAIAVERHRGPTSVENALMTKHPDLFRSRGFLSSYINGRRGAKNPDPRAMKAIADFLHVDFEWLVVGTGAMRRGGRGETTFEQAVFVARDFNIRSDAFDVAWERNRDRADSMTAEECFDAIRLEALALERAGVPRPESAVTTRDAQAKVRRQKTKLERKTQAASAVVEAPVTAASPKLAAVK